MISNKNMPVLVGALRSALNRLQEEERLRPDDPVLREIERSILRTIARREREKDALQDSAA